MRYDEYRFSKKEIFLYVLEFFAISGMIAYLYYDSVLAFVIFLPLLFFFLKRKKNTLKEKRLSEIRDEFIQMILSMASSLTAGYSVENSLKEAFNDMKNMYEEDSVIVKELKDMISQMNNGARIIDEMNSFAERTGIEEIKDFANVFAIAKVSGGRFSDIIRNCASIMRSNRETESEIQILISGKRFEQKIMNIIPFVLIACLRLTSAELIGVLYHNLFGVGIMTICLVIYVSAIYLSEKISDIRC